jgi:hypothetical protein
MTKDELVESGFFKAFISEYFEDKTHSFYPDKDRLLYVMCDNDEEFQNITKNQIKKTKEAILNLGFADLSFAYLLSCKPQSISGSNYIEPKQRFDFWLQRFTDTFIDDFETIEPINEIALMFSEQKELNDKVFEMEDEFWEFYPNNHKPKVQDFLTILPIEYSIKNTIEYEIEEYKKNEFWQFDFDKYKAFIDVSNPIETLFNLSELLVQLDRLEMFNDFLNLDNKTIITKQQKKTSYKWQKPDELPELYKLMIDKYKLIGPDTTLEQFRAVFTEQPIDDSFKPIKWHQDNASELLYFNDAIKNKVNNVWNIYQRMTACFIKPDGKPFDSNMKQLKTNIGINLSPDKQKAIDELVNNF